MRRKIPPCLFWDGVGFETIQKTSKYHIFEGVSLPVNSEKDKPSLVVSPLVGMSFQ